MACLSAREQLSAPACVCVCVCVCVASGKAKRTLKKKLSHCEPQPPEASAPVKQVRSPGCHMSLFLKQPTDPVNTFIFDPSPFFHFFLISTFRPLVLLYFLASSLVSCRSDKIGSFAFWCLLTSLATGLQFVNGYWFLVWITGWRFYTSISHFHCREASKWILQWHKIYGPSSLEPVMLSYGCNKC